jgi:hypothetical protein
MVRRLLAAHARGEMMAIPTVTELLEIADTDLDAQIDKAGPALRAALQRSPKVGVALFNSAI